MERRRFLKLGATAPFSSALTSQEAGVTTTAVAKTAIETALEKLGSTGGFPKNQLSDLLNGLCRGIFFSKRVEELSEEELTKHDEAMARRLFGLEEFNLKDRRVTNRETGSKHISLRYEREAFQGLIDLPQDIPLQVLFGQDLETHLSAALNNDAKVKINMLRNMLLPHCNETTTAGDLVEISSRGFRRYAEQALADASGFKIKRSGMPFTNAEQAADIKFDDDLDYLLNFMKKRGIITQDTDPLGQQLQALVDKRKRNFQRREWPKIKAEREAQRKRWQERQEQEKIASEKREATKQKNIRKKRDNPSLRRPHKARLEQTTSKGIFYLRPPSNKLGFERPSKVDWFKFSQAISSENASPQDIKVDEGGLRIVFNPNAPHYEEMLNTLEISKSGFLIAELPNTAHGRDLNHPRIMP